MLSIGPSFKFIDYAPSIFSRLRSLSGISKKSYQVLLSSVATYFSEPLSDIISFQESLDINMFASSLTNEKFSEGRSGSFFCFSPDKKFVIKTIAESECLLLRRTLKKYYNVFRIRFLDPHETHISLLLVPLQQSQLFVDKMLWLSCSEIRTHSNCLHCSDGKHLQYYQQDPRTLRYQR